MKQFVLAATGLTMEEEECWRQTGFLLRHGLSNALPTEEKVDLLCWTDFSGQTEALAKELTTLQPTVVLLGRSCLLQWPKPWDEVYSPQSCGSGDDGWSFGTKGEALLPKETGALLRERATGGLAEGLYYYLLREVFRETEDWCGHMSSVVGRM